MPNESDPGPGLECCFHAGDCLDDRLGVESQVSLQEALHEVDDEAVGLVVDALYPLTQVVLQGFAVQLEPVCVHADAVDEEVDCLSRLLAVALVGQLGLMRPGIPLPGQEPEQVLEGDHQQAVAPDEPPQRAEGQHDKSNLLGQAPHVLWVVQVEL